MATVDGRLLEGILHSAIPLAADEWGDPSSPDIALVAAQTALEVARTRGDWHII
jgi:hypothetical protein